MRAIRIIKFKAKAYLWSYTDRHKGSPTMTSSSRAAGEIFAPRQGNISDAEVRHYIRKARNLRAQAFHDVARGLVAAIRSMPVWARSAASELRHNSLWRAPGSGNCLNC